MQEKLDLNSVLLAYSRDYNDAVEKKRYQLSYHLQPWDKLLNEIEKRTFEDIRFWGVQLYPIFPITSEQYLHFANPFKIVGIEIVYKNSPPALIERKIKLLEASGWTIYTLNSQDTYYPLPNFFRIKGKINQ